MACDHGRRRDNHVDHDDVDDVNPIQHVRAARYAYRDGVRLHAHVHGHRGGRGDACDLPLLRDDVHDAHHDFLINYYYYYY